MHNLARLTSLWTWLPAFRAVAELENVHEAARRLHVTPSALSRSVKCLEGDVGVPLFERVGRNVRLTREGRAMLEAVRDAMRRVDDGVASARDEAIEGAAGIVCEGEYAASCLSRALARLHREHGIVGHVDTHWCADVPAMLVRGDLDVAFVTDPPREPRLAVTKVGAIEHAVYCSASHPLARRSDAPMDDVLACSFVAIAADATDAKNAGRSAWPRELPRDVALYAPSMRDAIELCATGELLAVLPVRALTRSSIESLVRLTSVTLPVQTLFAVARRALTERRTRAAMIVEAMQAELEGEAVATFEPTS